MITVPSWSRLLHISHTNKLNKIDSMQLLYCELVRHFFTDYIEWIYFLWEAQPSSVLVVSHAQQSIPAITNNYVKLHAPSLALRALPA